MDFLTELFALVHFWHWGALGVVLIAAETVVASGVFLGAGAAAIAVAAALYLVPALAWEMQLGGFVVIAGLGALVGRRIFRRDGPPPPSKAAGDPKPDEKPRPASAVAMPQPAPRKLGAASVSAPAANVAGTGAGRAAQAPPPPAPKPRPSPKRAAPKPAAPKRQKAPPQVSAKLGERPAKLPPPQPQELVGKAYTLWSPIAGGRGMLRVAGAELALAGPDLPAGSRIRVVSVRDHVLAVEPAT